LKSFLQSSDVKRFGGHVDQHHDLQELLLPGLAQLLNVISAMADEGVIVLEKICSLKNSVELKLALICGQTCHHICRFLFSGVAPEVLWSLVRHRRVRHPESHSISQLHSQPLVASGSPWDHLVTV